MDALTFKLDVIANNLANASTTAFKSSRTNFEDLFYQQYKLPGMLDTQGQLTTMGQAVGIGVRVQSTELNTTQGNLQDTGGQLDLAITGNGFFQINDGQQFLYTRAGNFSINANGQIVIGSQDRGRPIDPAILIPQDATQVSISSVGIVNVLQPGQTTLNQIGQIQLAFFINPQGLIQYGENMYQASSASGIAQLSIPGQNGLGTLRQNFLEASNVEPVQELVDLITTQRNYELDSQSLQVADQTLQLLSNLRRF